MRNVSSRLRVLLTAIGMIVSTITIVVVTGSPAYAAREVCNTARLSYIGNYEYVKLPSRSDSGTTACYLEQYKGSRSAVRALQDAIVTCYWDTNAADLIRNSGGVDGVYGPATTRAVKSLQRYQLGFTGSDVDGVYGPQTRKAMKWQLHGSSGAPLYPPMCKNPYQV